MLLNKICITNNVEIFDIFIKCNCMNKIPYEDIGESMYFASLCYNKEILKEFNKYGYFGKISSDKKDKIMECLIGYGDNGLLEDLNINYNSCCYIL